MSFQDDHEKASSKDEHTFVSTHPANSRGQTAGEEQVLYDPSKESLATRLGVNFESFKRAPGPTGYVNLAATSSHTSC